MELYQGGWRNDRRYVERDNGRDGSGLQII